MKLPGRIFTITVLLSMLLFHQAVIAAINPLKYGLMVIPDSLKTTWNPADSFLHILQEHPQLSNTNIINAVATPHFMDNKTADFYLLLLACIMLGLIRILDPRYFQNLWRAFSNPTLSARQLREKLEGAPLSNLLMNIFFGIVSGAYIYYAVRLLIPQRTGNMSPSLLVCMLIGGMMTIYLVKYALIRFSGWAFKIEGVTEHYIFNVFLINKVLAVLLLPFVIILAFGDNYLTQPALIVSIVAVVLLLTNRYTRSWQVFGSFFQYSKFHFFTYLCASELLPLAVLLKLLVRGLL